MPKTLLFATGFMGNSFDVDKYVRYIKYYSGKKKELDFDSLCIIDDGTESYWLDSLSDKIELNIINADKLPRVLPPGINYITFKNHLGRPEWVVTAGWFRSFTFSAALALKYKFDKLIHIESDAFVLTDRLFDKLKRTAIGWLALWCARHRFPETAIQVIGKDMIHKLNNFWLMQEKCWYGARDDDTKIAEFVFPFTEICRDYIGDRYGEDPINGIPIEADFACQIATTHVKRVPGVCYIDKIIEIDKRINNVK